VARVPRLLASILLGIAVVVGGKIVFSLAYSCEPREFTNPAGFAFEVYDIVNGEPVAVESLSFQGFLVAGRVGDAFYFNLTSGDGRVILSSVHADGRYYFVTRNGSLVESGVSPFFLHRPCFDTVIPNLVELRYFDIQLHYELVIHSKGIPRGDTFEWVDFGYAISVYSEEKLVYNITRGGVSIPTIVVPYFDSTYVRGYGLGGSFIVPRDVILVDGLNYSMYIGHYRPELFEGGEPTFLGGLRGFDVPAVALPVLGVGVGLALEAARRLLRRG